MDIGRLLKFGDYIDMDDLNVTEETPCKPKKKSRLLRLGKWTGYASSSVASIFTLGDALGYMKMDWMCIALLVVMAGIGGLTYWLRLHTTEAVK